MPRCCNIASSVLPVFAVAMVCLLGACESTSIAGPAGRRARMSDEQLQAVLEHDFPVGTARSAVRAKATELGMEALPPEAGADENEETYSFSFAPESSWGVTRTVRVLYGSADRVRQTVLVPRFASEDPNAEVLDQQMRGWIHVEGER